MNWYRNAMYMVSNQVKIQYKAMVKDQMAGVVMETPITVTYQVFKPTKRRLDKMNVISITSKFILDAMSEFGVIPDDNDDYVKDEMLKPTVHDKGNERVEVTFKTVGT